MNPAWMLQETQARRGPFAHLAEQVAKVYFYWASDCRLWINYCHDVDGYQIGETQYFPNKTQAKQAWTFA